MEELWQQMSADGLYSKSFEEFKQKYGNEEGAMTLHQGLSEDGLYSKDLDSFKNRYSFGVEPTELTPGGIVEQPISKEQGVRDVISEFGQGFWGEENLVPELKKALGKKYKVEQATFMANGVTITNGNKVSRTFNWDNMGSPESLATLSDNVLEFLDADTTKVEEKGPEWVEQEEAFKGKFLDQFFSIGDLNAITSQDLTDEEVEDQVFDLIGKQDWGIFSPSSWFGEGRTQFSALGDQDLRDAISDRFSIEKSKQKKREGDGLAAEWLSKIENGELPEGISFADWLKNRRATDILTLADDNERDLATLNVEIMQGGHTKDELIALEKKRNEVVERMNAPTIEYDRSGVAREKESDNKYTMVRDLATGELIRKPEGSEWDDAVEVEGDIERHQQNLDELVNTRKKHLTPGDILEAEYNRVSLALANIENEWSAVGSYNLNNLSALAQDENGVLTTKSGDEGARQQRERSGGKIAFSSNMNTKASFGDLVKIMRDQEKGYHEYAYRGPNGENRYFDVVPLDDNGEPVMSKEEFLAHTKRRRIQKQDLELQREALKRSYLLNEDVTSIEKNAGQNYANLALSSIFGQDDVKEDFFGGKATEREVVDAYADIFTSNGIELNNEQQEYVDRSLGETVGEGLAGSAGILLEFAVANKVTAGLRAAKLFKQGYKVIEGVSKQKRFVTTGYRSLDDILSSARGPRFFHKPSKQLWTQGRIEAAAAKSGMSTEKWLLKNAPKGGWQKAPPSPAGLWTAKATEATIEGLKFKAIGGDFSVGFGFGAAGQVLSPWLGTINSKTNLFGFTPKFVAENHQRLEKIYNLSFKGPSSFMVGSELGELSLAMSDDMMNGEEMGTFLEHHYPDLNSVGKRWASNYLTGVGFGFTHKGAYTKSESLNSLKEAKTEAEGKYLEKRTDYRIRNNKTGEEFNSPSKGNYKGKDFTILEKPGDDTLVKKEGYKTEDVANPITGEIIEKGRTVSSEQATIENAVKYQELADHHARAIRRSQDALDFVDEQLGQFKMEQDTKNQREIFKEYGMDVKVERGNAETMGNRDAEVWYIDADGLETKDPKKGSTAVVKYNVDRYAAGLAPHELGHIGMQLLFGRDARFKGDFLNKMMDMTKSIEMGGGNTLHKKLTEAYGGFGKSDFEAAKLNDWEVFSHLVQELKKPENLRALRNNGAFSQLKDLVRDKLEPELNHKYDLTKESDIVRFFGNYIESINKGSSSLGVLKHLDQVIDAKATEEGASLRKAYEELGIAFGERGMASVNLSRRKELVQDNIRLHNEKPEGYEELMKANVAKIKSLLNDDASTIERAPDKESDSDRKARVNKIEAGHRDVIFDASINPNSRVGRRRGEAIDAIINSYRGKTIAVAKSQGRFETPTFEKFDSTKDKEDFVWGITKPELLLHLDTFNRLFRESGGKEGIENDDLDAWINFRIPDKLGTALNKPGIQKKEFTGTTTDMKPGQEPSYTPEDMKLNVKTDARLRVDIRDRVTNEATPERKKEIEQGIKELNDFFAEFIENKPNAEIPGSYEGLKNIKVPKTILDKVFGKNTKERIATIAKTLGVSKSSALPQGTLSTRTGSVELEGKSIGVANTLQTVNIAKKGQPQNLKEVLYGTPERVAEFTSKETGRLTADADPTGQGNTPKELLKLSRAETLKRLGIKEVELGGGEVRYDIDNSLAKEYASEPGAKSEKDIMRNMEGIRKNYMEEVVRGMNYQAAMENLPEMARKIGITTEVLSNQISAGKARLASENLGRVRIEKQLEFLDQLGNMKEVLERNLRKVPSNLDPEDFIKAKEQAVVNSFKEHFAEYQLSEKGKEFNLSTDKLSHNANLSAIARQLNQQFKFSGVELLPEALLRRANQSVAFKGVRAIEYSKGLPVYGVNDVYDFETVSEVRGFYRSIARETILNHGVEVFDAMFGSGIAGGAGVGRYRSMSDMEAGKNAKKQNRHAHFEVRDDVRLLSESVVKELQAEGFVIPESASPGRTISDKAGDAVALFKHVAFEKVKGKLKLREDFDVDRVMEAFEAGEFNKQVLSETIEVVKKAYDKGELSHKAVRSILEGWFSPMLGLGKKSSSLAVLPDMTLAEMIKEFGDYNTSNYVLEHITPANYIKSRVYDYLLSGKESGATKEMMRLTLRDAHTTFIPKPKDTAVNKILQDDMGIDYAPGMNPIKSRYWFEGHLTNFDFPLKVHGGEYSGDVYSRTPNMSHKDVQERRRGLREANVIMLPKGMGSKNMTPSEILGSMKVIDQALANGRKRNPKRKGMSTWDFDDTLAHTKSDVLYTTPEGKKGKLNAEQFAEKGAELLEQGYEFDFSEFNKVTGGEPGPFLEKALERAKKFGTKDQFVLTARAPESAPAIYEFLKSQGLNIPLKNITGLGNSTGEAKAQWMLEKFAEGYNDMYFADDAMQNVKAVKNVLSQLDIKSKVQQARRLASENLSLNLNEMIERSTGIDAVKEFSGAKARMLGKKRYTKSLVVPGAQDFMGLMQNFLGKGKQGNKDIKFFEDNLVAPFARATKAMNEARQTSSEDLKRLYKDIPSVKKKLNKNIENSAFTYDQAIRSYLWEKAGYEIPGLSAKDLKQMTDIVKNDAELLAFAEGLQTVSKGDYVKPSEHWIAETIVSDLFNLNNRSNRSKFIEEWTENKNIIFSEANMNKIEATQGSRFREALEDMLYRMETGSNRPSGSNRLANAHMNFINGSVGATMFLNMRSAALQTISATNYINWAENNPAKAAAAFGNQKQYWKDFSMLWNSPMLKQRRAGLEYNVQEAELAAAVAGQKNKAKAAMSWLIKKGFTPTQLADSFAIAAGGSTYYRNRVKMYKRQGLTEAEAMEKSFLDFQEKTEASQQSSRADLISQQQSSALGRTVLAWANTPMQYMRMQEKATRNIINGRGDFKTNASQVAYYGVVQSLIFAALQSALFAYGLDDEEDMDPEDFTGRIDRVVNTVIDGQLRGMGVAGAGVSAIKNTIIEFNKQELKAEDDVWYTEPDHTRTLLQLTSYSPVVGSKLRKLYSAGNTWNWNREVISEMGLDLNNPGIEAGANVIEATTNIPLARLVRKIDNLKEVADSENQNWQRIAHLMGYSSWDVGTEDQELDAIKADLKDKVKVKEVSEETLALEKTFIADQKRERSLGQRTTCAAVSGSGERCKKGARGKMYCTIHQKVEQNETGKKVQCTHVKSDGKRCKVKTASKSGKCYYHD